MGVLTTLAVVLIVTGCTAQRATSTSLGTETTLAPPSTLAPAPPGTAAPPTSGPTTTSTAAPPTPPPVTPTSVAPSPSPAGGLSTRQLAGQRVIYSYRGLTPPASLLGLISRGEAAGVIFFGDNVVSHAQIRSVIQELERADASPRNPVHAPLLLMTDQEGGAIRRLSGAPLLSEKSIGQSAQPANLAAEAGTDAASNLRGVGMNVNLAPVLDVYRRTGDFDDERGRSYSRNPDVVSTLGAAFITAEQAVGVAATAKHFPGMGAAALSQNSDLRPVTLSQPLPVLRAVDEIPYQAAVAAGVNLVMVSWAEYPALDSRVPAGLSSAVVQGELRDRLHFRGVTISDALEAGALAAFGTPERRAVSAARAGMDLILCSSEKVSQGEEARNGLEGAYRDGALAAGAFRASVERVIDLRLSLGKR